MKVYNYKEAVAEMADLILEGQTSAELEMVCCDGRTYHVDLCDGELVIYDDIVENDWNSNSYPQFAYAFKAAVDARVEERSQPYYNDTFDSSYSSGDWYMQTVGYTCYAY